MNEETKARSITLIGAAVIIALALGGGLNQVGSGFASRSSEGITVTGSARVDAKADKAVWLLNAEYVAATQAVAVDKVGIAVDGLVKYLVAGGIPNDAIEFGSVSAYPQEIGRAHV